MAFIAWQPSAWGVPLDKDGTMKLGVRTYVNARIQTEHTDRTVFFEKTNQLQAPSNATNPPLKVLESQTFPYSPPGHLRQNRFYIEAEWDHDVTKLMKSFGPLPMLEDLPFGIDQLKYHLTYRGEGEGVYNWGPREFRTNDAYRQLLENGLWQEPITDPYRTQVVPNFQPPQSCTLTTCPNIPAARGKLRSQGTARNRLFQAYGDIAIQDLFIRIGRQILVWGETDAFRLADNINPTDSSFGGFLISLDERRVPIDMLRASYRLGEYGDVISEALIEGFFSWDNDVAYYPGAPAGSAWTLPNLGAPSGTTFSYQFRPPYSFQSGRGGARLLFNAFDATFSLLHYYTYSELPLLSICVGPQFPLQRITKLTNPDGSIVAGGSGNIPGCAQEATTLTTTTSDPRTVFNQIYGLSLPVLAPQSFAIQQPAKIQISGITSTFNIPATISRNLGLSGEPVVRTELAYIKDEPYYRQSNLDPFIYHFVSTNPRNVSGNERRDSINFVLGLDTNQFIRPLNPVNSFFITTQFFYKHIKGWDQDAVLPVPARNVAPSGGSRNLGAVEPDFVNQYQNQFLQTLLISTAYMSGQVNPSLTFFYDWGGSFVFVPSVTLVRDPFRFTMQYNFLTANSLKGNSGTSLLRDRDNVLFQFEYVI
jgi:hypothetical protein